jgi:hypothetical protein
MTTNATMTEVARIADERATRAEEYTASCAVDPTDSDTIYEAQRASAESRYLRRLARLAADAARYARVSGR